VVAQLAPQDIGVSTAEIQRFYTQRAMASHVQIVFVPDVSTARAAADALHRGEDFASVATRFDFAGILPPGGDVGFVQPGMLVSPVDQMRDAPVGSITGPVEAPGQGWFIVRITRQARRAGRSRPRPRSSATCSTSAAARFTLARYQELADEYQITTDPQAIAVFFDKFDLAADALDGRRRGAEPRPEQRWCRPLMAHILGGARRRGPRGREHRRPHAAGVHAVGARPHPAAGRDFEARRRHLDEDPDSAGATVNNDVAGGVPAGSAGEVRAQRGGDPRRVREELDAFSTLRRRGCST
jgi:hypothetical protein